MKTTITIETDSRVSLDKILESFRMTKGVKKVEASSFQQLPGFAYTHEERIQEIQQAEENIAAGKTKNWDDVKKEMAAW